MRFVIPIGQFEGETLNLNKLVPTFNVRPLKVDPSSLIAFSTASSA